jgi:glycosyltransferase involved in cell wall biosynthesis
VESEVAASQKEQTRDSSFLKRPEKSSYRIFSIFFHPSSDVTALGGAEKRFIETLKFYCKQQDLQITVLESAPGLLREGESHCQVHQLATGRYGKGWLSSYAGWLLWTLKAVFRTPVLAHQSKSNILLVPNNTIPNMVAGYAVSRILGLPICVVAHHIDVPTFKIKKQFEPESSYYACYRSIGYSIPVSLAKTLGSHLVLTLLKRANTIITVSNSTAKALTNGGIKRAKLHVSGNAIDMEPTKSNAECTENRVYDGVFVGRISKEKGVFDLLRLWRQVVRVRKEARLLIIGNGLELHHVKQKIALLGLQNRVFIRSGCGNKEMHRLLDMSRTFIFPSVFEGWGMAVADALSHGLPVVAYDIPAVREIFGDCRSVFLVPTKNLTSLTSTVLDLLETTKEEFRRFSEDSIDFAGQFSWEKVASLDIESLRKLRN